MEPQQPPEVLFCDLCNTSVPLQAFETGAAVRIQGRAVGPCCLPALRGGAAGDPAVPAPLGAANAAPAGKPSGAGGGRGHEPRVLPLGIAVLAAIAAATLFLEYRIDQADGRWQQASDDLARRMKAQADVLQSVSVGLDGVVRRADFDGLGERLAAIETAQRSTGDQVQLLGKDNARAVATLDSVLASVQEAERRRPDYGPALSDLRNQLQQQAVSLAEILARPRDAMPVGAVPEKVTPPPGLSAELAHQVTKLKDEDAATRFEAVDALLRSKDPAVIEHLLPMTKDADLFVRRLTVEGIKDFHKPAVVDALLVALADPEEIVRDTAWRSLKELTGQKLPFEAGGTRDAMARARQKWQEWWDKNRDTFGA